MSSELVCLPGSSWTELQYVCLEKVFVPDQCPAYCVFVSLVFFFFEISRWLLFSLCIWKAVKQLLKREPCKLTKIIILLSHSTSLWKDSWNSELSCLSHGVHPSICLKTGRRRTTSSCMYAEFSSWITVRNWSLNIWVSIFLRKVFPRMLLKLISYYVVFPSCSKKFWRGGRLEYK